MPSAGGASPPRAGRPAAGRRAEGPRERIGGELGGMDLGRAEATEFLGDRRGSDPRRVKQAEAADERHRRAAGGGRGAAPLGIEAGVDDLLTVGGEREADAIAARTAVGDDREIAVRHVPVTLRRGQMMLKRECVHPREDRSSATSA